LEAYEEAIARTSTKQAPWFVIPSNHKWFRNLAISQIIADTMEDMGFSCRRRTSTSPTFVGSTTSPNMTREARTKKAHHAVSLVYSGALWTLGWPRLAVLKSYRRPSFDQHQPVL
jgi:Polyphosphate kinase 2 (PPK2)